MAWNNPVIRRAVERYRAVTRYSDMSAGLKNVAQRMANAENNFLDTLVDLGGITRQQATTVLGAYRKAKVVKMDAVNGRMSVTHGSYLDRDVIRRAAGLEKNARTGPVERYDDPHGLMSVNGKKMPFSSQPAKLAAPEGNAKLQAALALAQRKADQTGRRQWIHQTGDGYTVDERAPGAGEWHKSCSPDPIKHARRGTRQRYTVTVTGRNGYQYEAEHLSGDRYKVGNWICVVEDGKVVRTVKKATAANIAEEKHGPQKLSRRGGTVSYKGFTVDAATLNVIIRHALAGTRERYAEDAKAKAWQALKKAATEDADSKTMFAAIDAAEKAGVPQDKIDQAWSHWRKLGN